MKAGIYKYGNGNVYRSAKHEVLQMKVNITSTKLMPLKQLNYKGANHWLNFNKINVSVRR